MLGQMQVTKILQLTKLQTLDEAVAELLRFTDYPTIIRWFQFPKALVLFLAPDDAPDCGAIYVYDRKRCVWLWVDFDDRNYGGYSSSQFDVLINQCHFFGIVESPALLESPVQWFVAPGQRPTLLGRLQIEDWSPRKDHSAASGRNADFRLQIAESQPSTNPSPVSN